MVKTKQKLNSIPDAILDKFLFWEAFGLLSVDNYPYQKNNRQYRSICIMLIKPEHPFVARD